MAQDAGRGPLAQRRSMIRVRSVLPPKFLKKSSERARPCFNSSKKLLCFPKWAGPTYLGDSQIAALAAAVEAESAAVLDAVAAVDDAAVSFANVIEPLMAVPHFKTNPAVCQAKFLQHCSILYLTGVPSLS